jgi:hypothetical protein
VQREFRRPAGHALAWLGELPEWSSLSPLGQVTGYWRWRRAVPSSSVERTAAWGYRVLLGGSGQCGLLGARFEPHGYSHLQVSVAATVESERVLPGRFEGTRVGLPLEYVGGVLAGALAEPDRIGPGILTFDHAAVDEVESSWEAFRVLAIGVVRLLGLPPHGDIPTDLLPRFGGSTPDAAGAD